MKGHKLIELAKTLSEDELKQFVHFCRFSTYHKKSLTITFAELLLKLYPDFKPQKIKKEIVFSKLYPNETFKQKKLYDLIYFEMRLIEEFIAYLDFSNNDFNQKKHLIAGLRKRNHKTLFAKKLEKANTVLLDQDERDNLFFYNQFLLAAESDRYFIMNNLIERNNSIREKVNNLDLFYLSTKLKASCEMLSREVLIAEKYNLDFSRDLVKMIESNHEKYLSHPAIKIYLLIFKLFDDLGEEDLYLRIKKELKKDELLFPKNEQKVLYEFLMNYCVGRINFGINKFMSELFGLYKHILGRGLLIENGQLSQWTYMNIATLGQRLNKFSWTNKFIIEYNPLLNPVHQENALTYNTAALHFSMKEYKKALQLLHQVEFIDATYNLGTKSILLKTYYEILDVEPFPHLVKSFQTYIRTNKLMSKDKKDIYFNMVKYTRLLFNLKLKQKANKRSVSQADIDRIKKPVMEQRTIANLNWIMDKISELENKL
jgi:hypothetical protein